MNKIDLIEDTESELSNEKSISEQKHWRDALNDIKVETNSFDIESMCTACIKKQAEYGFKDENGVYQKTTIQCTGLNTYKNKVVSEHGLEVYDTLKGLLSKEQYTQAEQVENSMAWMTGNINDAKLFNSRPHQVMINACSAKKKVLRMGRRCIDAKTKVSGVKKDYSAKHLFNLFKAYN